MHSLRSLTSRHGLGKVVVVVGGEEKSMRLDLLCNYLSRARRRLVRIGLPRAVMSVSSRARRTVSWNLASAYDGFLLTIMIASFARLVISA